MLSRRSQLDPLLNLLTLPIRPASELVASSQLQRLPHLTNEEIMVIAAIPMEELRHTRAAQDWLAAGRQEGLEEGRRDEAAAVTLRLLNRRCGPLSEATTAQIQALPLEQLEALAVGAAFSAGVALLDFQGPADLATWLTANS